MRLFLLILLLPSLAIAQDAFRATDLPLPRFVSLSAVEAHVRAGPGKKYPIKWTCKKSGYPLEIILEFDHWRKVRDVDGEEGWLHKSLLSGRRTALVIAEENRPLYKKDTEDSKIMAYITPQNIVRINECGAQWSNVDASGYKGWINKVNLWGVYETEIIEK